MTSNLESNGVLTLETARTASEQFIGKIITPPPDTFRGRGIIIAAGGLKYFTNAWVCAKILRHLGCRLPIEIWHFGENELDTYMRELMLQVGAECIDALKLQEQYPMRVKGGWELKSYAVLHSSLKEILFLDADNVPTLNPEYLFNSPQFRETGAVFWPDFESFEASHPIWNICGVPYREEPQFESGQFMVDKERCWKALCLSRWYNDYSDFYYKCIYGDKDTFHMAFRKLTKSYAMPETRIYYLQHTMCHHDFNGKRIFQHRNFDKWSLFVPNKRIHGFMLEDECFQFLTELRDLLTSKWKHLRFDGTKSTLRIRAVANRIINKIFKYDRVGYGFRNLEFLDNGFIGLGQAGCEVLWNLKEDDGNIVLEISSKEMVICRLKERHDGVWEGRWIYYEQMPVELSPIGSGSPVVNTHKLDSHSEHMREAISQIVSTEFEYCQIGYDSRTMTFLADGKVGCGTGANEIFWCVKETNEKIVFEIWSENRLTCSLENIDGVWRGARLVGMQLDIELVPTRNIDTLIEDRRDIDSKPARIFQVGFASKLTLKNSNELSERFITKISSCPNSFQGRGIVIPAGGLKYFTNAWVCIKMLRYLGCQLPIEVWYLGEDELNEYMRMLLQPLGVKSVDALKIRQQYPVRILKGHGIKPYALLHCDFKEVLLLDADNVPVENPDYLFDTRPFKKLGAVFWPGFSRYDPDHNIWNICGVSYQDEPEFESGQILVNKSRCWAALCLSMWYNEYSDFYYQYILKNKDTFYMAFRKLNQVYAMPSTPLHELENTMCQHDFEDKRLFQHRNGHKWDLFGINKSIKGFKNEDICLKFVRELKELLGDYFKQRFGLASKSIKIQDKAQKIVHRNFIYKRFGYDFRPMTFLDNGVIGVGNGDHEVFWDLKERDEEIVLEIQSEQRTTCELIENSDGRWRGRWHHNEKMPHEKMFIEIIPI